jgi:predicted N-acyltransferase
VSVDAPADGGTVEVVDRGTALPADAWDALAGAGDLFLSRRWLAVVTETSGAEVRVLLDGAGGLVTAVATRTAPWLSGRPDTLLERGVREGWPGSAELRAALPDDLAAALLPGLVCGGRHLGRTRPLVPPGTGPAPIERLVRAAERLAADEGLRSVSFLYVDEHDDALRDVLTDRGYACHESGRYSWLPVPSGGLSEHLATLSAHRARRIRAECRRLAAAGVVSAVEPLTRRDVPELAELEAQLLRKYGMDWSPGHSRAILASVLEAMGEDALVSTARVGGRLVGFCLVLRHRGEWYAHRAGFDYAAQGRLPLYFDVVYYRPLEAAAAAGVPTIHYGTGSADAKRARGCLSTRQLSYLRRLGGAT